MEENLIYDVGVNIGTDTAYYLHKGYRVVGIEANPALIESLRAKFADAIRLGQFTLLNVGVARSAGEFEFWVCDEVPEWSSFNREIASRNGVKHHRVMVRTEQFDVILARYGIPYYCKIDIEGNDRLCLSGLEIAKASPQFVSIELSQSEGIEDLRLLKNLGYSRFKVVSQVTRAQPILSLVGINSRLPYKMRRASLAVQKALCGVGRDGAWTFEFGSSGPFGELTPGPWRSYEHAIRLWQTIHAAAERYGSLGDWYDFHAAR